MSLGKVSAKNSSEVVFFLGSGASVNAGVPDTFAFVKEFRGSVTDGDKQTTINKVIDTLKEWKRGEIDIELLLETLIKLDTKEKEPLLKFFKGGKFILGDYSEKRPIIDDLKDFIKKKAIVKPEKIKYLRPLLSFIEEFHTLDIISVNYDICVEQFCNEYKLTYQDGFDIYWNPKVFETENTDIRLYKLHGSVMWYQSDKGGYIKLPVMTGKGDVKLITGERAESLMLYPMQKWEYAEPFLELLVQIKHILESENCKFLIVIGYSFRDDHIKRMLWDVAKKNRNLNLIIVDPKAQQVYNDKLKYYDVLSQIPSPVDGRVTCLPYKFEGVLPYLKDYYLKNLRQGLRCITAQHQNVLKGEKANWLPCLRSLINAEQVEKAEEILKQIDRLEFERNWRLGLELALKMFVNLAAGNQEKKAPEYLKRLRRNMRLVLVERMNVGIIISDSMPVIQINFNYVRTDSGSSYTSGWHAKEFIISLYSYIETRKKMILSPISDQLSKLVEGFKRLQDYFEPFEEEGIKYGQYIRTRGKRIGDTQDFINKFQSFEKSASQQRIELNEELSKWIMKIEKEILMTEVKI
ncbi:MAG: SIR2 family protein [Candidatus Helarchaeota archaeon]|nr:SIR2 family protein [Candidatus Helarchaeota archaeon]